MQNKLLRMSFGIWVLSLFVSCGTFKDLIPPNKRPFQERIFDSKLWREGDAQTRGKMSKDLRWKKYAAEGYLLDGKTQSEILTILGEPDRKTRGRCCGAGGTSDEEVWLYNIEVNDPDNSKTTIEHFQIYFQPGGKVDAWRISLWDDKNPDYFPRIG